MTLLYIYIYIYESKVFGHSQKFLFLILKVLVLMRQIKHHNSFVYEICWLHRPRYQLKDVLMASEITVFLGLIKYILMKKANRKKLLKIWFNKMTSFGRYHGLKCTQHSKRQKVDWILLFTAFLQEWWAEIVGRFGQVHPTSFQWDLSLLIAPA